MRGILLTQSNWNSLLTPSHRRGRRFFAGGDFPLADRRPAFGAEIIENLFVRQN